MVKKIWLGTALVLVVLTSSFYLLMPDKVRIDFEKTRTVFKVYNETTEKFDIAGIEYVRLFDGTTLMRASNRIIGYDLLDNTTIARRESLFKDSIMVNDRYEFNNNITDVSQVPINHEICFTNATGKIFEYMIDKITYDGETKDITSPFSFDKNMKLTFQDGYYAAKVYNYKTATDKIKIRYRITSDDECFDVRLIDPDPEPVQGSWQINQGNDDVLRRLSPSLFLLTHTEGIVGGSNENRQFGVGLVFNNISIPQGSSINDGTYLIFKAQTTRDGDVTNTTFSAEDVDDSASFIDDADAFDTRWASRTSATVNWDEIPHWTQDVNYTSPELKTIIQEVIDRGGWSSGNNLTIFWEDYANRSDNCLYCYRNFYSYESSTVYAPILVINYTEPQPIPPAYSDNSTDSTMRNTNIEHRLKWEDDTGLSGYIFSFDNGTGTFVNDTWTTFDGVSVLEWSNVTKLVSNILGDTIRWCVYANDSANGWNNSCDSPYSYATTFLQGNFNFTNTSAFCSVTSNDTTTCSVNLTDYTGVSYATMDVTGIKSIGETEVISPKIEIDGTEIWSNSTTYSSSETTSNFSSSLTAGQVNYFNITADTWGEIFLDNLNFTLITDTCTCPGDTTAHEFNCADDCSVATCTAGATTFTGSGMVNCTGAWDVTSLGDPGNGCVLYIDSGCTIDE